MRERGAHALDDQLRQIGERLVIQIESGHRTKAVDLEELANRFAHGARRSLQLVDDLRSRPTTLEHGPGCSVTGDRLRHRSLAIRTGARCGRRAS